MLLYMTEGHDNMVLDKVVKEKLGLVQVYTGEGKGKTTACLGLGFRAAGDGLKVLMLQFLKPQNNTGEQISAELLPNFTFRSLGLDHFGGDRVSRATDVKLAEKAFKEAKEEIYSNDYDMVILDEINVAMDWKLLDPEMVVAMLRARPEHVEIVLSGRGAPGTIMDYADLVTEMRKVKHPFDKGVHARRGVEF